MEEFDSIDEVLFQINKELAEEELIGYPGEKLPTVFHGANNAEDYETNVIYEEYRDLKAYGKIK